MKDNQYDVKRLGKVITNLKNCFEIFYHMDEREYRRMRDYISNRFDTSFPYNNPATKGKKKAPNN